MCPDPWSGYGLHTTYNVRCFFYICTNLDKHKTSAVSRYRRTTAGVCPDVELLYMEQTEAQHQDMFSQIFTFTFLVTPPPVWAVDTRRETMIRAVDARFLLHNVLFQQKSTFIIVYTAQSWTVFCSCLVREEPLLL